MKLIAALYLQLTGWKIIDKKLPMVDKAILIFAPHTSNWDFMTMMMAKFYWRLKVRYLGKHTLFRWPCGWFFKALGGIPVVRHENNNVVGQVAKMIDDNEHILLAIAPEGTRRFTPFWKTGFYHIAKHANLPIIMFYLDASTRTIGFSDLFQVSGDLNADMKKFSDFFADKKGYNPEQTSIVQTKKQYKLSEKSDA